MVRDHAGFSDIVPASRKDARRGFVDIRRRAGLNSADRRAAADLFVSTLQPARMIDYLAARLPVKTRTTSVRTYFYRDTEGSGRSIFPTRIDLRGGGRRLDLHVASVPG
jgi:hypothetical protein